MKLKDKVAIVTGSAMGIGRAIALSLAREGADVVVVDIESEQANKVVDEIRALGSKAIHVKTDVGKSEEVNQMVKTVLSEVGKVDILVNCAGGTARERASLFHKSTEEVWDSVIERNLKGVLNCCRAIIEHMMDRRSGRIINIGSIAGMVGLKGLADYSAAKAGVIGFTKALAKEVISYGINVNCVSPAGTDTRAMLVYPGETLGEREKATGFGRLAKPEEIANMVVFLASDDASFITGQNHGVCGLANLGF